MLKVLNFYKKTLSEWILLMANRCKMFSAASGKGDYLQSTPAFFMRRSEAHWFVLLQHPLGDLSCFSFQQGFMSEEHYAWPPNLADNLLMRFITLGCSDILTYLPGSGPHPGRPSVSLILQRKVYVYIF